MEIRRLEPSDDCSRFQSGDPDLDRFFKQYAGQNQFRHHVGVTYVAAEDGRIFGFATVAPSHLEIEDLNDSVRGKLPNYPLPILRLARLAVDQSARGKGLGKILLRFVLGMAVTMAEQFGCVGVVVDAKPGAVGFYQELGFIALEALEGMSDARPQPKPMFLSLASVKLGLPRG